MFLIQRIYLSSFLLSMILIPIVSASSLETQSTVENMTRKLQSSILTISKGGDNRRKTTKKDTKSPQQKKSKQPMKYPHPSSSSSSSPANISVGDGRST
jgi:hypothetical protein